MKGCVLDLRLKNNTEEGLYLASWCIDNVIKIRASGNANGIKELSNSDYNAYIGSTRNNTGANTIAANSKVGELIT